MYTALVLTEESQEQLKLIAKERYPELDWELVCHHMTLHMGPATEEERELIGNQFFITVDQIGRTDKAVAMSVDGVVNTDAIWMNLDHIKLPHITLMVNRAGGGKPVDSNKILAWLAYIDERYMFDATLQEVV